MYDQVYILDLITEHRINSIKAVHVPHGAASPLALELLEEVEMLCFTLFLETLCSCLADLLLFILYFPAFPHLFRVGGFEDHILRLLEEYGDDVVDGNAHRLG